MNNILGWILFCSRFVCVRLSDGQRYMYIWIDGFGTVNQICFLTKATFSMAEQIQGTFTTLCYLPPIHLVFVMERNYLNIVWTFSSMLWCFWGFLSVFIPIIIAFLEVCVSFPSWHKTAYYFYTSFGSFLFEHS